MKSKIIEKIEIPYGIEAQVENNEVNLNSNGKEIRRRFNFYGIEISKQENSISIESKKATKKEMKVIYTIKAHIINMISGLKKPFVYKLEVAYVHFPMTLEFNKEKRELLIKNFLGEKNPRKAEIQKEVDIEINKNIITIISNNKELAGQAAANIEKSTRIRNRDRRKFQDGIFIIEKPGRTGQ